MKKKEDFVVRKITDEYVMMPVGQTALKFNGLIMANEVSAFIWDNIEKINSVDELTKLICSEFDVSYEEAYQDTEYIINEMLKAKWIE